MRSIPHSPAATNLPERHPRILQILGREALSQLIDDLAVCCAFSRGQTIDFLLSARRDAAAAKRFFRKAIAQRHIVNPRTLTVDKNPAYPGAVADMKSDGQLWRRTRLRQCKYLTDVFDKAFPNPHGG